MAFVGGCDGRVGIEASEQNIVAPFTVDDVPPFQFPSVGSMGDCTVTEISPSHVLYAVHCGCPSIIDFAPQLPGSSATQARVIRCWNLGTADASGNVFAIETDVAIALLDRPIPHPLRAGVDAATVASAGPLFLAPMRYLTGDMPAPRGAIDGTAVGYGATRPPNPSGESGPAGSGTRRFRVGVRASWGTLTLFATESVVGRGDSGGPLFAAFGGEPHVVVGVAHSGAFGSSIWASLGNATVQQFIASHRDANHDGRPDAFCPHRIRDSNPLATAANDTDGDWVLDADDSCPNTYNPCQVRMDSDHDGIDDDCEQCPRDPRYRDALGSTTLDDMDLDGVPDVCDCQRTTFNTAVDADGDSIRDALDDCPSVPNTLQENCDGPACNDGRGLLGDACRDVDHDGVLDLCHDFARGGDNCLPSDFPAGPPTAVSPAFNPDQRDCNLDAELHAVQVPRGDACDARPCGDTVLQTRDVAGLEPGVPGPTLRLLRSMDQVWIDAVSTAPQSARSGLRFCACDVASTDTTGVRRACETRARCVLDFQAYGPAESPAQRWRRTTLEYEAGDSSALPTVLGSGLDAEAVADYQPPSRQVCSADRDCPRGSACIRSSVRHCVLPPFRSCNDDNQCSVALGQRCVADGACSPSSFRHDLVATWHQATDNARWFTTYGDTPQTPPCMRATECPTDSACVSSPSCVASPTPCTTDADCPGDRCAGPAMGFCTPPHGIGGVLWTHTPGPGFLPDVFADANRLFTSHYWSGLVASPRGITVTLPRGPPLYIGPLVGPDLCLECDASFPAAFLALGSLTSPGDPVLNVRGSLLPAAALFSTLPIADRTLTWLPVVEADEWLARTNLRYVALDSTGAIVHVAVQSALGIVERIVCPPGGCKPPGFCPGGCLVAAGLPDPPPEAGIAVLSATTETLFVVGATDGFIPRQIMATPLGAEPPHELDLGSLVLGHVLAATYSASDRALYTIDEVECAPDGDDASDDVADASDHDGAHHDGAHHDGAHRCDVGTLELRIARISPLGGGDELGRWPRNGHATRMALAEAPDGTLYLATSGEHGAHFVLRIEPHVSPPRIVAIATGPGPLASAHVRAGRLGLSLVAGESADAQPVGYLGSAFRRWDEADTDTCF